MLHHPAWTMIILGLVLAIAGLLWLFAPPLPGFGKLPGDINIEKQNVRFYFPIMTCIILSVLLTGIAWTVRFFFK